MNETEGIYITAKQAASSLSCCPNYVSELCRKGLLKAMRSPGGPRSGWRIDEQSVFDYLKTKKTRKKYSRKVRKKYARKAREISSSMSSRELVWDALLKAEPMIREMGFEKFMDFGRVFFSNRDQSRKMSDFWKQII
jgi:hypothetical protein